VGVLCQLRALIPGQRPAQLLGQCRDRGREGIPDSLGAVPGQRRTVLDPATLALPSMRGRCSSKVNRVLRSTRVPTAKLPSPMIRSPSQCPGTARSVASGGRD
jgi:hypothetical protein